MYDIEELESRKKEIFDRLRQLAFDIDIIEEELSPLQCEEEELKLEWKEIQSEIKEIELRTAPKLNMFQKANNDRLQTKIITMS